MVRPMARPSCLPPHLNNLIRVSQQPLDNSLRGVTDPLPPPPNTQLHIIRSVHSPIIPIIPFSSLIITCVFGGGLPRALACPRCWVRDCGVPAGRRGSRCLRGASRRDKPSRQSICLDQGETVLFASWKMVCNCISDRLCADAAFNRNKSSALKYILIDTLTQFRKHGLLVYKKPASH